MDVQAIGGSGGVSSAAQLEMQYMVRVAALQKDVINQVGEETLRLLESATVTDPAQGQHLDVRG